MGPPRHSTSCAHCGGRSAPRGKLSSRSSERVRVGTACYPEAMPAGAAQRIRLKPADPFDLVRWLARSQSDPRKAVAELVQNSIDAQAKSIVVERRRLSRAPAIVVTDDGEGVLPQLGRE